jgi:hypothetical protein
MLCEPRLRVVMGVRGDMQREDFHNSAAPSQPKTLASFGEPAKHVFAHAWIVKEILTLPQQTAGAG